MRNLELMASVLGFALVIFAFVLITVHAGLAWDDIVNGFRLVKQH